MRDAQPELASEPTPTSLDNALFCEIGKKPFHLLTKKNRRPHDSLFGVAAAGVSITLEDSSSKQRDGFTFAFLRRFCFFRSKLRWNFFSQSNWRFSLRMSATRPTHWI